MTYYVLKPVLGYECFHYPDVDTIRHKGSRKPHVVTHEFNKCAVWIEKVIKEAWLHKGLHLPLIN